MSGMQESETTERRTLEARLRFLAEASATLAASLDYETTLASVARLTVPALADLCVIYLREPSGSLRCVALSHADPRKEALARDLLARFAHAPDRPYGPAAVMRTGQTAFYPSITEEMLAAVVEDPALLAGFRDLGLHASLVVPLIARGQALGTISLLMTESGRRFQPEDVALAEDLARRASVAVDNAWLFQTAQEAMAQKDLALRALEAERARLEAVLQQMPAAVVLAEAPAGRIVFSNAKVEQVLGEAVPPLSNTADFERFWSAWPRERGYAHYDPSEWPLMRAIQRGEALVDREFELVRPDGRRATLLTSTAPIHDRDGRIVAAVATITDITSRKRAEDGLRFLAEAGEILASSLDYATTLKSVARLAVPRLADWCGVDIVEEDGSVSRLAVAHVDPAKVEWAYQLQQRYPFDPDAPTGLARVLRTGEAEFYPELSEEMLLSSARDEEEKEIIRRIGFSAVMIVPLIARGRTLGAITLVSAESGRRYDEDDLALARELARRAALAVDNARLYREAQEAEARSRQQAARVRALAEASRAFAEASLDLQAVLDTVSRHIAGAIDDLCVVRLLSEDGCWLEPVAVHHTDPDALALMRDLVARDPFPADEGFLGQVIQRGEPLFIPQLSDEDLARLIKPEYAPYLERYRLASALAVPLRVGGRVIGAIGAWRATPDRPFTEDDLTFLQELADRAAQAIDNARLYQAAQEATRARETFLSIASHELKTPLTTVKAYGQLLQRFLEQPRLDRERLAHVASQLVAQTERFETLINDLLDVSRIQRGRLELRPQPTDLSGLAAEVLARFEQAAERTSRHTLVLDAPAPVRGRWDPARIDQVLTNLVSNALKYSPQGGEVRVRVRQDGEAAVVQVSDHGVGIAPEEQARLFRPFVRGERVRTSVGGTGLGLYIAWEMVAQHGGEIAVESTPGQGSTFTVRLPLAGPEGAGESEDPSEG